jgi:hypothetical protein
MRWFGRIFDALAAFCMSSSTLMAVVAAHDLWPLSHQATIVVRRACRSVGVADPQDVIG